MERMARLQRQREERAEAKRRLEAEQAERARQPRAPPLHARLDRAAAEQAQAEQARYAAELERIHERKRRVSPSEILKHEEQADALRLAKEEERREEWRIKARVDKVHAKELAGIYHATPLHDRVAADMRAFQAREHAAGHSANPVAERKSPARRRSSVVTKAGIVRVNPSPSKRLPSVGEKESK